MAENSNKQCEGCGGQITPNQIIARQAGLVNGVLLCPGCIAKKREELMRARAGQAPAGQPVAARATTEAGGNNSGSGLLNPATDTGAHQGAVWFPPERKGKDVADETLSLVEEDDEAAPGRPHHQIRSFAESSSLAGIHHDGNFKRQLSAHNEPATRCRTFHGKLTAAGLAHMDEQINEWIDSNPDVFIKSSNSTVGVFEGKTKEPHLLVTVFY